MKCSCCGRKKKIMESFEDVGNGGDICVNCSDILYHICDAVKDKNKEEYEKWVKEVKNYSENKKTEEGFEQWFAEDFLKRNGL